MKGGHPGMGMMGGMGGFGMMGGMGGFHPPMNRMGQNFWKGGPQRHVGEMTNAAIIGTSATVYSDHLEGISKNQLVGRGMALCRHVRDGHCLGKIPYCCTIGRDNLPAMETASAAASAATTRTTASATTTRSATRWVAAA